MSSMKDYFEEGKEKLSEEIAETKSEIKTSVDKGIARTGKFMRRLVLLITAGLVLVFGVYMLYANWTYSEGTRTGYLIKISNKGYLFKTYEGQLNLGGFQESGSGIVGNIWNFSLTDDALYKEMGNLEGKKVKLYYQEINQAMPWQGDTNYFITKVELNE